MDMDSRYPFTTGDLVNCSQLCVNYLENNSKVGMGWTKALPFCCASTVVLI
eukprot:SAG22_NODE_4356_length_1293_cov_2.071189_2_plen_51_part_00